MMEDDYDLSIKIEEDEFDDKKTTTEEIFKNIRYSNNTGVNNNVKLAVRKERIQKMNLFNEKQNEIKSCVRLYSVYMDQYTFETKFNLSTRDACSAIALCFGIPFIEKEKNTISQVVEKLYDVMKTAAYIWNEWKYDTGKKTVFKEQYAIVSDLLSLECTRKSVHLYDVEEYTGILYNDYVDLANKVNSNAGIKLYHNLEELLSRMAESKGKIALTFTCRSFSFVILHHLNTLGRIWVFDSHYNVFDPGCSSLYEFPNCLHLIHWIRSKFPLISKPTIFDKKGEIDESEEIILNMFYVVEIKKKN